MAEGYNIGNRIEQFSFTLRLPNRCQETYIHDNTCVQKI